MTTAKTESENYAGALDREIARLSAIRQEIADCAKDVRLHQMTTAAFIGLRDVLVSRGCDDAVALTAGAPFVIMRYTPVRTVMSGDSYGYDSLALALLDEAGTLDAIETKARQG